jgi:hydroxymethylbilane synthase
MRDLLQFLHHLETAHCVIAERTVNQLLGGDCFTAIGAHAKIINDEMQLAAMVGSVDGKLILRAKTCGDYKQGKEKQLGEKIANDLLSQGAEKLIHHA